MNDLILLFIPFTNSDETNIEMKNLPSPSQLNTKFSPDYLEFPCKGFRRGTCIDMPLLFNIHWEWKD